MTRRKGADNPPVSSPRPSHISLDDLEAFLEVTRCPGSISGDVRRSTPGAAPLLARAQTQEPACYPVHPTTPAQRVFSEPAQLADVQNSYHAQGTRLASLSADQGHSAFFADAQDADQSVVPPHKVTAGTSADHDDSGARGKRGEAVTESTRGLSPPRGDRQVPGPASPVTDAAPAPSQNRSAVRSPSTSAIKEKQAAFLALKDNALAATSLDDLVSSFRELVTLIRDHRKSGTITACLDALDAVQSRLDAHYEFPREDESAHSFSVLSTESVSVPIQILAGQLQARHQAIQVLSKSMDSVKTAHKSYATPVAPSTVPSLPKLKSVPITNAPDERILLRCDGDAPPLFSMPYHELVPKVNTHLAPLGLPKIVPVARRMAGCSCAHAWSTWGPGVFLGARIVPPAVYSHIQLDGIPFVAAPELSALVKELEEQYPDLGPVVGEPTWVNKPPSETHASAIIATGGKPRMAGSVFIRLQPHEKVDFAVSLRQLRLAGSAPTVVRAFPHLRVTQSWGCFKFGHVKAKCLVKETKCGSCGETAHGAIFTSKPKCLNCGGEHRADAFSCPARKRVAESLCLRAIDLTEHLNATSSVPALQSAPRLPESV
ncbi:hypothetical protein C8R44DRAFT_862807 [Mycena epipterygia]|nr:hypothetical protein C8R44DRAFT_862807 [Mycena epipterygia]